MNRKQEVEASIAEMESAVSTWKHVDPTDSLPDGGEWVLHETTNYRWSYFLKMLPLGDIDWAVRYEPWQAKSILGLDNPFE